MAANSNHSELVRILVENGANPNIPDAEGNNGNCFINIWRPTVVSKMHCLNFSALHYAVSKGSVEAVKVLLIESSVDPFSVNQK